MSPNDTKIKPHYSILTVIVERQGPSQTQTDADAMLLHKLRLLAVDNKDLVLTIVRKKGDETVFEDVIP
jgi:hypothetical protein